MTEQAPPPPATPAGWYPEGANGVRYWDGRAWTDQRAPAATAPQKRIRNYLGDIALVLALVGLIIQVTQALGPAPIWIACIAAIILANVALRRAGKSRTTAIIAIIVAGLVLAYYAIGILYLSVRG